MVTRPRPARRGRPGRSRNGALFAGIPEFKFHRNFSAQCSAKSRIGTIWPFNRGDSDFFTLDPNLATALKNTNAGGTAPPKPSQNVEHHAKKKGSAVRFGEGWVVPI